MDDLTQGGPSLREALAHLRRLNRLFGAAGPTLYGVKRLWRESGQPVRLTILDIGAGSGDVNRRLLRWARKQDVELRIVAADITPEACAEARAYYRDETNVSVEQADLFQLPEKCADIVTGTQLLHHFDGERLVEATTRMMKAARLGVVVNDIHRHWLAWTAVWLATRVLSRNPYIRNDGPLSVAKGFRLTDWRKLCLSLDGVEMKVSWRPLFRYAVVLSEAQTSRHKLDHKGGGGR